MMAAASMCRPAGMAAGAGRQKHQKGAQALAAGIYNVSGYLVDQGYLAVQTLFDDPVDGLEISSYQPRICSSVMKRSSECDMVPKNTLASATHGETQPRVGARSAVPGGAGLTSRPVNPYNSRLFCGPLSRSRSSKNVCRDCHGR